MIGAQLHDVALFHDLDRLLLSKAVAGRDDERREHKSHERVP